MPSFTEQAILKVIDQSTGPIKAINKALRQLFATAKSLKSIKIDIDANARGLSQASAANHRLAMTLPVYKAGPPPLQPGFAYSQNGRWLNVRSSD